MARFLVKKFRNDEGNGILCHMDSLKGGVKFFSLPLSQNSRNNENSRNSKKVEILFKKLHINFIYEWIHSK